MPGRDLFCVDFRPGAEPISPGSTIALLLSILSSPASYSVDQSNLSLVFAGIAIGALAMTKINIGIFALVGLAVGLVVGNSEWPRPLRGVIAVGAVLLPFVLMFQRLSMESMATWAFLVALSMVGTCPCCRLTRLLSNLEDYVQRFMGWLESCLHHCSGRYRLAHHLREMVAEVLIRPLHQVNLLTLFPIIDDSMAFNLITGLVVTIAFWRHRFEIKRTLSPESRISWFALSAAAVVVLVLAIDSIPIQRAFRNLASSHRSASCAGTDC